MRETGPHRKYQEVSPLSLSPLHSAVVQLLCIIVCNMKPLVVSRHSKLSRASGDTAHFHLNSNTEFLVTSFGSDKDSSSLPTERVGTSN